MTWRDSPGSCRVGKDAWRGREESGALSGRGGKSAPGEIPEGYDRPTSSRLERDRNSMPCPNVLGMAPGALSK